jgi:hypothetical protein
VARQIPSVLKDLLISFLSNLFTLMRRFWLVLVLWGLGLDDVCTVQPSHDDFGTSLCSYISVLQSCFLFAQRLVS